ncbi:hypothetical protein TPY_3341 [Sulfobacillus acidophilus TPY]|uniref:Ferritin-like domain-containing protein n=1 Tax=Sulfobacillus acidophilus (strain ATCC 700253 / DSM 10332 / NAL) TaxID=679936 RepID=G8TYA5_SULAD|nr:hypothetical protein TPY_3341 [Sulfobacillus acidophilus TPY]AEW05069.1 hypothetical protein Sulac_1572 [Sulfobacillus acidophilus DSM 10332]
MIQVDPQLTDEQFLRLFEKGITHQWTADEIDWGAVQNISTAQKEAIGQLMTPVYLGEQTAMLGVSAVIPMILNQGHPEPALYLSSMGLDEARHFRNLNRLYRTLGVDPLPSRRIPEMWRYHARLLQKRDPVQWVFGILISDLFAKTFYGGFGRRFPDTVVGRLSRRTLQDEARHQAFSDRYLNGVLPTLDPDAKKELLSLRDDLFRVMDKLGGRLQPAMETLEWSSEEFLTELWDDTERWAVRLGLVDHTTSWTDHRESMSTPEGA